MNIRKEIMSKNKVNKINYVLELDEAQLSILGSALHYCISEIDDFICCENCQKIGIEVLEEIFDLFKRNHKHS